MTGVPLAPASLKALPEHRREFLLWWHALELDYDGVEDLVLEAARRPCGWHYSDTADGLVEAVAALGSDGYWHLRLGEALLCGDAGVGRKRRLAPGTFEHEGDHPRPVRWTFTLTGILSPPELVAPSERCPCFGARKTWPAHHNPARAMGRIRIQLAAQFGAGCHACRRGLAAVVDHDHRTGIVRGLLCRNCNTLIDHCPHLAGCPWADYLSTPPAAALNLRFPGRRRPSGQDRARAEYLGFTLFD